MRGAGNWQSRCIDATIVGLAIIGAACEWASARTAWAAPGAALVQREAAARVGLERAWFAQVPVDAARSRVTAWYLFFDRLYAVTDSGIVAALNSETGELVWTKQIGHPGEPAFGPGANSKYLGVVTGDRLLILDRYTGRVAWIRELSSAPSSGPALSGKYAYVALMTGRIEGYPLADPKVQPWYYQSKGRTYMQPTTTGAVVSWPTAEGYLYVSSADSPRVEFRLETGQETVTSPAEADGKLFIASLDGYLYCIDEFTGYEVWRFSTGYPITSSPAVVNHRVFVASIEPALHAIDAANGSEIWMAPGASHFAAQGKDRVYAADRYGNLLILDSNSGRLVDKLFTSEGTETIVNDQSDRIFLVSNHGLVQCLHEIGASQPTMFRRPFDAPAPPPAKKAAGKKSEKPPTDNGSPGEAQPDSQPAVEDNPFGDAEQPADSEPTNEESDTERPAANRQLPPETPAEAPPAEGSGIEDENPFD